MWRAWGRRRPRDAVEGVTFPEAVGLPDRRPDPIEESRPRGPAASRPPNPRAGTIGTARGRRLGPRESRRRTTVDARGGRRPGLSDRPPAACPSETIRAARLGWTPGVVVPNPRRGRCSEPLGWVIPWFDRGPPGPGQDPPARRPTGRSMPKRSATRPACLLPEPRDDPSGRPLVVVEGEFDALVLGEALGDLAAVVTLGARRPAPTPTPSASMLAAPGGSSRPMPTTPGTRPPTVGPPERSRVRPPGSLQGLDRSESRGCRPSPMVARHPGRDRIAPRCSLGTSCPTGAGVTRTRPRHRHPAAGGDS